MLVLFLEIVALFDDSFDISFNLGLHLLVPLCLPPLLVEPLLELLDLQRDLIFATNNLIILALFSHELAPAVFDFIPDLLGVLKVHFFDLAISCLNIVTEVVGDGFLSQKRRPNID